MDQQLISRRRFLHYSIGYCYAAIAVPITPVANNTTQPISLSTTQVWSILDAVQQHLLPSEPDCPGATEINALKYLQFVVNDPMVDQEIRTFIPQGAKWLEDVAQRSTQHSFLTLDKDQREQILQHIATTQAGENWLSVLITFLMESLLADPVYGGNPNGIGWIWLQQTPGFPRPSSDKTYPKLATITRPK